MKETYNAFISWAQASIAYWHSTTVFNIFGWLIDKIELIALIVGVVVLLVVAFFVIVGLRSPDKLSNEPRRRPGMD